MMTRGQIARELFSDTHKVKVGILIFRIRALAHRMLCFGFEEFVNSYEPRELLMLSTMLPDMQARAVVREAHRRSGQILKGWIERTIPEAFSVPAGASHE